jgi:hypothetical protein
MISMVLSAFLALGAAAAVLVVASAAGGRGGDGPTGMRAYLADVRAGLHTLRSERRGAVRITGPEPVDATIEDVLDSSAGQDPAYLGVDDLTETLARARQRATRHVGGTSRR